MAFKKITALFKSIFNDEFSEIKQIKNELEENVNQLKKEISELNTILSEYNGKFHVYKFRKKELESKQQELQDKAYHAIKHNLDKGEAIARNALLDKKALTDDLKLINPRIEEISKAISVIEDYMTNVKKSLAQKEALIEKIKTQISLAKSHDMINKSRLSEATSNLNFIKSTLNEMEAKNIAKLDIAKLEQQKEDPYAFLDNLDNEEIFNIDVEIANLKK